MNNVNAVSAIEKFKEFSKDATIRCGVPYTCKVFQVGQAGEPTSVKGEIYLRDEKNQEAIPVEMVWNLEGQAMLIGPAYDLVKEIPFGE